MAGDISRQNGKKGGRPSAYQEKINANALYDAFFGKQDVSEVVDEIKSGKYSMFDRMRAMGLSGNERMIAKILDKLIPDLNRIDGRIDADVTYVIKRGKPSGK